MSIACRCPQCGDSFQAKTGRYNRALKLLAPLYCGKPCAVAARRFDADAKKALKAAYDREYRERNAAKRKQQQHDWYKATRDPERERQYRQANMARHVEYCRRPEYRAAKADYDRRKRDAEYRDFAECARLLIALEKEIRSQASAYERRVANGYYLRSAQKRRRELWQLKKTLNSTPATSSRNCGRR